jgi:hypothetical protein
VAAWLLPLDFLRVNVVIRLWGDLEIGSGRRFRRCIQNLADGLQEEHERHVGLQAAQMAADVRRADAAAEEFCEAEDSNLGSTTLRFSAMLWGEAILVEPDAVGIIT